MQKSISLAGILFALAMAAPAQIAQRQPGPGKEIGSGAGNIGTGAAPAGKDVGVGTVMGAGKRARGIGRAFKKLF